MSFETIADGREYTLSAILGNTTPGNYKLHLYKNSHVPDEQDELADYTEVDEDGYSYQELLKASWSIDQDLGLRSIVYPEVTFNIEEPVTIYGWFITDNAVTIVIWAQDFTDGPYSITDSGTVKINLRIFQM